MTFARAEERRGDHPVATLGRALGASRSGSHSQGKRRPDGYAGFRSVSRFAPRTPPRNLHSTPADRPRWPRRPGGPLSSGGAVFVVVVGKLVLPTHSPRPSRMAAMLLPPEAAPLLALFAAEFTSPTAARVHVLTAAAVPTAGRRTVAGVLRTLRHLAPGHVAAYRRVPSRADWSGLALGCALARLVVARLPADAPVRLAGDDTVDGHTGRTAYGKARHRDPVRSSHAFTAWRYGHTWVVLAGPSRRRRPAPRPGATSRPWTGTAGARARSMSSARRPTGSSRAAGWSRCAGSVFATGPARTATSSCTAPTRR